MEGRERVFLTARAVSASLICSTKDSGAREAGIALLSGVMGAVGGTAYGAHAGRVQR